MLNKKQNTRSEVIHTRATPEVVRQLNRYAANRDLSQADVIEIALKCYKKLVNASVDLGMMHIRMIDSIDELKKLESASNHQYDEELNSVIKKLEELQLMYERAFMNM